MNSIDEHKIRNRIFKLLDDDPNLPQRQMVKQMGISLGKFNYCLNELVKKGFVKINRFKSSQNKAAYVYILTLKGIDQNVKVTSSFLHRKMKEYEEIKTQIKEIRKEIEDDSSLKEGIELNEI